MCDRVVHPVWTPPPHGPLGRVTSLLCLGEGDFVSVSPAKLVCTLRLELMGCGEPSPPVGGLWLPWLCKVGG